MAAIDWSEIYRKYRGLWVALKDDEKTVVGSGKTLKEALEESKRNGYPEPIMTSVPDRLIPYVGFGQ